MFCGNCGKELPEGSQFCGNCGKRIGGGSPTPVSPSVYNQTVNVPSSYNTVQEIKGRPNYPQGYTPKKWITALVFLIFLGIVGAHRFYVKKIGTAILMFGLTLFAYIKVIINSTDIASSYDWANFDLADYIGYYIGYNIISSLIGIGLGIWWIIDFVKIWTGKFTDKQGYPLVK